MRTSGISGPTPTSTTRGSPRAITSTSMCYHLMRDYGWEENAIPEKDIQEVIQQLSAREEGQIVWNTLTLKWLMNIRHVGFL